MRQSFAALGLVVLVSGAALAAGGDVDPTFGAAGFVSHLVDDHDVPGPGSDDRWHLARGGDGRLVAARSWYDGTFGSPAVEIHRFHADGTVDVDFGTGGSVQFGPTSGLGQLLVQPDDKILVMQSATLRRFDSSGASDAGFGTGGAIAVPGPLETLALQSDGKLVTATFTCDVTPASMCSTTVRRYLADGSADGAFGTAGAASPVTTGFSSGRARVGVQSDGGIVIAVGNDVARLLADGTRDIAFGTGGVTSLAAGVHDLAVLPDDRIVVLTYAPFAVVRLTAAGAIDATFGAAGTSAAEISDLMTPARLLVASDGSLTVLSQTLRGLYQAGLVSRFDPDGSLAVGFAPCGHALPAGLSLDDGAMLPDGRVLLAGSYPTDQALAQPQEWLRFVRLGTPDPDPPCAPAMPGSVSAKAKLVNHHDTTRARWRIADVVPPSAFGDPSAATGFAYCVVDPSATPAGVPVTFAVPGGVSCRGRPCWHPSATAFRFASPDRFAPKLKLRSGDAGKALVKLRAYVQLPSVRPLTLRIDRTDGPGCWEATLPSD